MIAEIQDNKGNVVLTVLSYVFAGLAHIANHFESHAGTYAALAAVLTSGFTIANIIRGWLRKKTKT